MGEGCDEAMKDGNMVASLHGAFVCVLGVVYQEFSLQISGAFPMKKFTQKYSKELQNRRDTDATFGANVDSPEGCAQRQGCRSSLQESYWQPQEKKTTAGSRDDSKLGRKGSRRVPAGGRESKVTRMCSKDRRDLITE